MEFARDLKAEKERCGLTAEDMARALSPDLPERTLINWLRGDRVPPPYVQDWARRIARSLPSRQR